MAKTSEKGIPNRLLFLDGLRGFACLQVVLAHFMSAFYQGISWQQPAYFHYSWEKDFINTPLSFFFNGFSAVAVFFLISGAALTYSFENVPRNIFRNAARRVTRLVIPIIASVLFAFALFLLFPDASLRADQLAHADWMGDRNGYTASQIFRDIFDNLVFGYKELSLFAPFPDIAASLQSRDYSLNTPLWTMHVELYGSFLVILLVALRSMSRPLYLLLLAVSISVWIVHPMVLFIVGHLCARIFQRQGPTRQRLSVQILALCSIAFGILEVTGLGPPFMNDIYDFLSTLTLYKNYDWPSQAGAFFIFGGVLFSLPIRKLLETRLFLGLGKISFSLYLLHLPIMMTVVSQMFCAMFGKLSYAPLTLCVFVAEIRT